MLGFQTLARHKNFEHVCLVFTHMPLLAYCTAERNTFFMIFVYSGRNEKAIKILQTFVLILGKFRGAAKNWCDAIISSMLAYFSTHMPLFKPFCAIFFYSPVRERNVWIFFYFLSYYLNRVFQVLDVFKKTLKATNF